MTFVYFTKKKDKTRQDKISHKLHLRRAHNDLHSRPQVAAAALLNSARRVAASAQIELRSADHTNASKNSSLQIVYLDPDILSTKAISPIYQPCVKLVC